jgi:hypothetical protein
LWEGFYATVLPHPRMTGTWWRVSGKKRSHWWKLYHLPLLVTPWRSKSQ